MKKQQRRIVSDMLRAVMGVCCAIQLTVATAYGGWLQTASGTYDYLEATNWTDNVIDNTFPATLTLAGAQTATFGADHTAASGLVFGYGGNFALTLRAAGGDRSLKLQGDVLVDTTGGTTANVTLGSANSNEKLNIDLDGATRAFEVSASRSLTLRNVVSTGGLVKTGAGTLSLAGANTFEGGVSCNGGIVSAAANSNLGPATGAISFDGGALRLGAQDANTGFSLADRPVTVNIGGGKLYSYKNSGSYTFGQTIAGAGELKTSGGEGWGSPTFVFTASNDVASVRMQNGTHNIDLRHPHAAGVGVLALDSGYAGRAIRLKNDDSVTYAMAGITAPCNFTIDVKQTTAAGVDQTLAIPAFTMTPQDQKDQLTVTGANGYRLQINSVTLVSGWTDKQLTLNPTTAPLTVGNMNIQKGQIFLNGTHADNRVTGVISGDNGGGNVLGNIIKESTSTWTLEGANTYYGRTTVNAGALVVNGGITSANGAMKLLWDDDFLYIGMAVQDDVFCNPECDAAIWRGDGLQFLVDPCRDSEDKPGKYDYCLGLGTKGPQAWCGCTADAARAPTEEVSDFRMKITPTGHRGDVVYEIAVPWNRLSPFAPAPGANLGLAMIVNDDDGRIRDSFIAWFGCAHSKQMSMNGDLILLG